MVNKSDIETAPSADPLAAFTDLRGAQAMLAAVNVNINVVTLGNYARAGSIPGATLFEDRFWIVPKASIIGPDGLPLIEQPKIGYPVGRKRGEHAAAAA
ncbi:MAG: hypothetical protein ABI977_32535 [Acidobacteriota bacterium]